MWVALFGGQRFQNFNGAVGKRDAAWLWLLIIIDNDLSYSPLRRHRPNLPLKINLIACSAITAPVRAAVRTVNSSASAEMLLWLLLRSRDAFMKSGTSSRCSAGYPLKLTSRQ
jgi:hypothetical protein